MNPVNTSANNCDGEPNSDNDSYGGAGFKKPLLNWKRPKGSVIKMTGSTDVFSETEPSAKKVLMELELSDIVKTLPQTEVTVSHQERVNPKQPNEIIKEGDVPVVPVEFPYKEPSWKGVPEHTYYLEELKSGVIEREIDISGRSATVIGRMEGCHICLLHPSISRFHAVLQYRANQHGIFDKGFYLYDLGSTHGTFLNKLRVRPQTYQRIQVGHIVKFGGSSRMFILQGPEDDQEMESEFTVTELKKMRQEELHHRKLCEEEEKRKRNEEIERNRLEEERKMQQGIDWGMSEDADEETDLSENPYAVLTNEELYADDPKKELMKWLERHGEEMKFDVEQAERGKIVSRITLPIVDQKGVDVVIESSGKSKKEATNICALEACQHIDRMGLWKRTRKETQRRVEKNWEQNDFYDSDEDSFFDRTGELESKRKKRMKKAGKLLDSVETYESLMKKHKEVLMEFEKKEKELEELTILASVDSSATNQEDMDELDAFMENLKKERPSRMQIKSCEASISELRDQEKRLIQLINAAKPASIPNLKPAEIKKKSPKLPNTNTEESIKKITEHFSENPEGRQDKDPDKTEGVQKDKVIGPMLPPSMKFIPAKMSKKNTKKRKGFSEGGNDDYNNITWVPPVGQTGDGRTSLNDKLGY